jgi:hypothetical protein
LRILWSHIYHLTRLGSEVEKQRLDYELIFSDLKPALHSFITQLPPFHAAFQLGVDVMSTMLRYSTPTPPAQLEYAISLASPGTHGRGEEKRGEGKMDKKDDASLSIVFFFFFAFAFATERS